MQVGARAETGVHEALRLQLVESTGVCLVSIMLEIGTPVPCQAERFEIVHNLIGKEGLRPLLVEVLDSQHDASALLLCQAYGEGIVVRDALHAVRGYLIQTVGCSGKHLVRINLNQLPTGKVDVFHHPYLVADKAIQALHRTDVVSASQLSYAVHLALQSFLIAYLTVRRKSLYCKDTIVGSTP